MSNVTKTQVSGIRAIHDHILVTEMNFSERITSGGILLPSDDRKNEGIRPRWALVVATGPKQKDVEVGQFILVAHGRWTRGITIEIEGKEATIRRVDNKEILLVSDEPMTDDTMTSATTVVDEKTKIYGSMHNSHLW